MTVNQIGDKGAKSMSEVLKVNTTLTALDLRGENEMKAQKIKKDEVIEMNDREWDWRRRSKSNY